jgi:hypothetical protein
MQYLTHSNQIQLKAQSPPPKRKLQQRTYDEISQKSATHDLEHWQQILAESLSPTNKVQIEKGEPILPLVPKQQKRKNN